MRRVFGWIVVGALAGVALAAALASPALGAASIPFQFHADPYTLQRLALQDRPGSSRHAVSLLDHGIHDDQGVRMHYVDGKLLDFPRGQSSYGISNLGSYVVSHNQFYLDRALAQADRLVATHTDDGDAWYFPTWPSRNRHGRPGEFIQAPYYSALTQGRILLFFARLAEVTGLPEWRDAADHAFQAFLRPGPRIGPYVVDVDPAGYYWLQEWPWAGMQPDDTLNGHITSSYGLLEYYLVTGDERAAELFRGAVTTVQHYIPQFRRPGWICCYCLRHRSTNANYHGMHIGQFLKLYQMTGDLRFARAADIFMADYPRPRVSGGLQVEPGTYEAVRVGADGTVVRRRDLSVTVATTWETTLRRRLWPRSPVYLYAASGPAAGWWLPEQRNAVYLLGIAQQVNYDPPRRLTIAAGESLVAFEYDQDGVATATLRVDTSEPLELTVVSRAVVNGYDRVRVSDGDLAGYWLQLRAGVRLY
jgi:hypothetical protein